MLSCSQQVIVITYTNIHIFLECALQTSSGHVGRGGGGGGVLASSNQQVMHSYYGYISS